MNLYGRAMLLQRPQVCFLPAGLLAISLTRRHPCRKVSHQLNIVMLMEDILHEQRQVKPSVGRIPYRAVVQVEAIHIDSGSHARKKARASEEALHPTVEGVGGVELLGVRQNCQRVPIVCTSISNIYRLQRSQS